MGRVLFFVFEVNLQRRNGGRRRKGEIMGIDVGLEEDSKGEKRLYFSCDSFAGFSRPRWGTGGGRTLSLISHGRVGVAVGAQFNGDSSGRRIVFVQSLPASN